MKKLIILLFILIYTYSFSQKIDYKLGKENFEEENLPKLWLLTKDNKSVAINELEKEGAYEYFIYDGNHNLIANKKTQLVKHPKFIKYLENVFLIKNKLILFIVAPDKFENEKGLFNTLYRVIIDINSGELLSDEYITKNRYAEGQIDILLDLENDQYVVSNYKKKVKKENSCIEIIKFDSTNKQTFNNTYQVPFEYNTRFHKTVLFGKTCAFSSIFLKSDENKNDSKIVILKFDFDNNKIFTKELNFPEKYMLVDASFSETKSDQRFINVNYYVQTKEKFNQITETKKIFYDIIQQTINPINFELIKTYPVTIKKINEYTIKNIKEKKPYSDLFMVQTELDKKGEIVCLYTKNISYVSSQKIEWERPEVYGISIIDSLGQEKEGYCFKQYSKYGFYPKIICSKTGNYLLTKNTLKNYDKDEKAEPEESGKEEEYIQVLYRFTNDHIEKQILRFDSQNLLFFDYSFVYNSNRDGFWSYIKKDGKYKMIWVTIE